VRAALPLALLAMLLAPRPALAAGVVVGSKRFVESYVLAEIVTQRLRAELPDDATRRRVEHRQGLGGTAVVYRALLDGAIDVYPEYTGTLAETVVREGARDLEALRASLGRDGLSISASLGFENTYALAVKRETAERLGLGTIADLAAHPELRVVLSHEFLGRQDGWPGLSAHYRLEPKVQPRAIDHALAYEALSRGEGDVMDVYSTDAKVLRFDLVVLRDVLRFFPPYDAVLVYRSDLPRREPAFAKVLAALEGSIDGDTMRRLDARADLDGVAFTEVARQHLAGGAGETTRRGRTTGAWATGLGAAVLQHGPRHLGLVGAAVLLSTVVGLPLGVLAARRRRLGGVVLAIVGIVQTIPSLALFCFFIPILGIGPVPALAALFLYGLLPVVRNTHAGLLSVAPELREAAEAIGLSSGERLRLVELPLAAQTILAGIKTSAVVAVGSATIAAFVGAGGFGEPISTGLSLNDVPVILHGAIPAAVLALLVEGLFTVAERVVVPRALREDPRGGRDQLRTRASREA